jgi:hypothetical protein
MDKDFERKQELFDDINNALKNLQEEFGATSLFTCMINERCYGAIYGRGILLAECLAHLMSDNKELVKYVALSLEAIKVAQQDKPNIN